jgi:hypothetical protein
MAMSYISTASMTADINTKEFVDQQKWQELCRQVGIHTMETIEAGDLLSIYLSPTDLRSAKQGDNSVYEATALTALLPAELQGLKPTYGYHDNEDGTQRLLVREPTLYREPTQQDLNRRSTWVLIGSRWEQIEYFFYHLCKIAL